MLVDEVVICGFFEFYNVELLDDYCVFNFDFFIFIFEVICSGSLNMKIVEFINMKINFVFFL